MDMDRIRVARSEPEVQGSIEIEAQLQCEATRLAQQAGAIARGMMSRNRRLRHAAQKHAQWRAVIEIILGRMLGRDRLLAGGGLWTARMT